MNKYVQIFLGIPVIFLGVQGQAQATLIGDTVDCAVTSTSTWSCDTGSAIVGAGTEFSLNFDRREFFQVDLGASSVLMDYTAGGGLQTGANEVLILSDLDWVGTLGSIVGISNFLTAGTTGIDITDVMFSDHEVRVDFNSGFFASGDNTFISFDLEVQHEVQHVPEPTTLSLLSLGLVGLGAARRKKG
jgi:hypothetical protein